MLLHFTSQKCVNTETVDETWLVRKKEQVLYWIPDQTAH